MIKIIKYNLGIIVLGIIFIIVINLPNTIESFGYGIILSIISIIIIFVQIIVWIVLIIYKYKNKNNK